MNDKDKSYFAKLILVSVIFISLVAVFGSTAYLVKNKRIMNLQLQNSVSPLAAPVVKDDIANWKTYRNDEYGFEIKYPRNYIIHPTYSYIQTSPESRDVDGFYIVTENMSIPGTFAIKFLHKNINERIEELKVNFSNCKSEIINVSIDIKKIKLDCGELNVFQRPFIYYLANGFEFDINKFRAFDEKLADQIISTFRFTN